MRAALAVRCLKERKRQFMRITDVSAMEILDSRGNPTVKVEVRLENGSKGGACVPSGASTGQYEAYELRDGDRGRFGGKGVLQAVGNVNGKIAQALAGMDADDQKKIDRMLCEMDGTPNKKNLGANAILGVSLAVARAAAQSRNLPLWKYLNRDGDVRMPVPMMNILNGGAHAANALDVQEFMILPVGAPDFAEGLRMGAEIYHTLGARLRQAGHAVGVGDEGGFAPDLSEPEEAMTCICEAIAACGYTDRDVKISLDIAASEWQTADGYRLPKSGREYNREELCAKYRQWCRDFPIYSLEDPFGDDDWDGFAMLKEELGDRVYLVGDDLFVTNTGRLRTGIEKNAANAILIKPNQIGTLTETLDVIAAAKSAGYLHILSHRSGETEDTVIADLAVATGAPLIKSGAPCRSERVAKYNRLLTIAGKSSQKMEYGRKERSATL